MPSRWQGDGLYFGPPHRGRPTIERSQTPEGLAGPLNPPQGEGRSEQDCARGECFPPTEGQGEQSRDSLRGRVPDATSAERGVEARNIPRQRAPALPWTFCIPTE
jgi:hypothetical protein